MGGTNCIPCIAWAEHHVKQTDMGVGDIYWPREEWRGIEEGCACHVVIHVFLAEVLMGWTRVETRYTQFQSCDSD